MRENVIRQDLFQEIRDDLTETLVKLETARSLFAAHGDAELIEQATPVLNWIESEVHELFSQIEPARSGH